MSADLREEGNDTAESRDLSNLGLEIREAGSDGAYVRLDPSGVPWNGCVRGLDRGSGTGVTGDLIKQDLGHGAALGLDTGNTAKFTALVRLDTGGVPPDTMIRRVGSVSYGFRQNCQGVGSVTGSAVDPRSHRVGSLSGVAVSAVQGCTGQPLLQGWIFLTET